MKRRVQVVGRGRAGSAWGGGAGGRGRGPEPSPQNGSSGVLWWESRGVWPLVMGLGVKLARERAHAITPPPSHKKFLHVTRKSGK